MAFCLTNAVVKLKHLHRLVTFLLALQAILIESKLAVVKILLSAQQNV